MCLMRFLQVNKHLHGPMVRFNCLVQLSMESFQTGKKHCIAVNFVGVFLGKPGPFLSN